MDKMWKEIKYIQLYNPYRRGTNPNFNNYGQFSKMILSLKKKEQEGINYLYKKIIDKGVFDSEKNKIKAIMVVPSHDPDNFNSGINSLAEKIAQEYNWINATGCLRRKIKVPKLSEGGNRSIDIHLESIEFVDDIKIKDKCVLLIDDITTTGISMKACKSILIKNGIIDGFTFAIGQTAH